MTGWVFGSFAAVPIPHDNKRIGSFLLIAESDQQRKDLVVRLIQHLLEEGECPISAETLSERLDISSENIKRLREKV